MKLITNRTMGRVAVLSLSVSATMAVSVPADAALVAGPMFHASVTTNGYQRMPAVAIAADGSAVVAWSATSPGSDSSGTAILARRFAPDGTPVGSEFQVNSTTTGDQYDAAVAVNASGAFAIVWTSTDGAGIPSSDPACGSAPYGAGATVDCHGTGIRGQLYTSAGVVSGSEMLVNGGPAGGTLDYQNQPDVALADDGTLLTTWTTNWTTFDGSGSGIAGRQGSTFFQANTTHAGYQQAPSVTVNASGAFAIVWTSTDGAGIPSTDPACGSAPYGAGATVDCHGTGIRGQLYTSAGVPSGPEMLVNGGPAGGTLNNQNQPDVALADDGTLLTTWTTFWTTFDGSRSGIAGRRGASFFQANTTHADDQYDPTVAVNASGEFAVAWTSEDGQETASGDPACGASPYGAGATVDCYGTGIRSQLFTSEGVASGPDVLVNGGPAGGTPDHQSQPAVALADDGTMLATWASEWTTVEGGLHSAVVGRYFRPAPAQPPVANPDVITTSEDSPLTVDVRANDIDPDGSSGALTVSITTGPSHGTATVGSDQSVTYTPDADYSGPDSLTYQVTDSDGLSSNTQVTVTVTAVNDAPTAVADSFTVPPAGGSLAVLTNDSDVDGDSLVPVIVAGPIGGTAAVQADGTIAYTPAAGTTTDTFTYRADDGQLGSSTVTVAIAVSAPGTEYAASVQQPIDTTGDPSTFSAKRGVIPIKWRLTADGAPTCELPPATISLTRVARAATGPVDESTYGGTSDSGYTYRVADCQYHYNLDPKRLGPGSYQVSIVIDGTTAGTAAFELR